MQIGCLLGKAIGNIRLVTEYIMPFAGAFKPRTVS